MFSQRLYRVYSFALHLGKCFGVTSLRFNKVQQVFYCDDSKRTRYNLFGNFFLIILFVLGFSAQTLVLYLRNDLNRMNLTLPFLLGVLLLAAVFSISVFFPVDLCIILNGLLGLLNQLHSKFLISKITPIL